MRFLLIFSQFLKNFAAVLTTPCALSLVLVCSALVGGCFNAPPPEKVQQPVNSDVSNLITNPNADTSGCEGTGALHKLWQERSHENNSSAYPVGPGDILQVTVTDLPEITKISARVNGQGKITLPVLGDLDVAGLSEEEASQLIAEKARTYVRDPRVNVFAQHFAGRNVSVMGMVALPGTYALDSPSESILSVLGRAGGLKGTGEESAAQRVVLFPAGTGARQSAVNSEAGYPQIRSQIPNANVVANSGGPTVDSEDPFGNDAAGPDAGVRSPPGFVQAKTGDAESAPPGQIAASGTPIIIDLAKPSMASCLNLPARPGDIILVPAAGQVGVYGWVKNPGEFNITPGMTVLSAITSAGGAMFSSNVELLRTSQGTRISTPMNLSRVENGQEADRAVQSGDVVVVKGSAIGALPYGVYTLLNKFGTGMYLAPGI